MDEEHPLQSQSPYAASKIAADKLAESFYRSFDLPVAIIRPFNTFGPRQSARAVIPSIISQALTSDTVKLGALTPIRDFTFIEDMVSAFLQVAKSDRSVGHVFNIGTGRGVSIAELAEAIIAICPGDKNIIADTERFRPRNSEVLALVCNRRKANDVLGWRPCYTLDQGLLCTIEYIRTHLTRYKTSIFNR
jgi:nucleoside-diphosphate-sugar epimerase